MYDQANQLRRLVGLGEAAPGQPASGAKLVVVAGGKGGVGTTTMAASLAVALARNGHRAVLVDADPRGGDAAMLCGIRERSLPSGGYPSRVAREAMLQPGPAGLHVLPASSDRRTSPEASAADQWQWVERTRAGPSRIDIVLVDAGNGPHDRSGAFWPAADLVLLVTTPEVIAMMDAYAAVKRVAGRGRPISVVTLVNRAAGRSSARHVHQRIARACRRFLALEVDPLGHVVDDPTGARVGLAGELLLLAAPRGRSAVQIRRLADSLLQRVSQVRAAS